MVCGVGQRRHRSLSSMPQLRHTRQCEYGVLISLTAKPVRMEGHTLEAWRRFLLFTFTSCEVLCLRILRFLEGRESTRLFPC